MNETQTKAMLEKHCKHCGKKYTKLAFYKKHYLLCEITHKTEKERNEEKETEAMISSQTDLIKVVQHLVQKCNQLETKMGTMMRWVQKEKKKIKIIDWLQSHRPDSHYYPEFLWEELSNNIYKNTTERHIEIIKQKTFLDGLHAILEESFQNKRLPLCSFSETLYLCESWEPLVWKECSKKTILAFINGLQKKLLFLHGEWKKNNRNLFDNDDKVCENYNKTMMKMLMTFSEDGNYNKLKRMLTNMTKLDVKNLVEYSFEN
jgi:hypothetical protein